jgi:hypothetical protein
VDNDPIRELEQLVSSGALDSDPQVKAAAVARVQAARQSMAGPQVQQPSAPVGPPKMTRLQRKAMDLTKTVAQPKQETLPTTVLPRDGETSDVPVMHSELPFWKSQKDKDAAWMARAAEAEKKGQRAVRTAGEWPLDKVPFIDDDAPSVGEYAKSLGMRAVTDFVAPAAMRADEMLSGGVLTKGPIAAMEAGGVVPKGTLREIQTNTNNSPIAGAIGTVAGALVPGGLAGRIGGAAKSAVAPMMNGFLGKAAGYGLSGGLSGGLTSAVSSGVGKALGEVRGVAGETKMGAGLGALGGLVFGGLGELGRSRTAALRDPEVSREATDLALAEGAGARTSMTSGIKPGKDPQGQAFRQALDEMKPEAAKGYGLDAVAADRASKGLGRELASYQDEVLQSVDQGNKSVYAQGQMVSTEPLVMKNLELLRKATHPDSGELPGHSVAALGREMGRMARIEVVPASSEAAHAADPSMVMQAGQAAAFRMIPKSQARPGMVAIVKPINVSAEQLDDINQMYASRVSQGEWSPAEAPIKGLQAAGLQTRGRLGGGVEKMKAAQADALNEMNNTLVASGLPRATKVDLTDQATKNSLFNAVRGYKAGNTVPNDKALDAVVGRSPQLRSQMDQAAAVGAYQRLRGQATPNIQLGASGTIRPWGLLGAAKLHLDPVFQGMGRMGEKFPGLPVTATAARRREK